MKQASAWQIVFKVHVFLKKDWALNVADIASKWVEQQFAAHIAGRLLVPMPLELDPETMVACGQLASVLAEATNTPPIVMFVVKLDINVIRYNEALAKWELGLNDSYEEALLAKFPPTERLVLEHLLVVLNASYQIILWYLSGALNLSVQHDMYTATIRMGNLLKQSITSGKTSMGQAKLQLKPGCINISPCWFQQGHECHGPLPVNPEDGFMPKVSTTLKGDRSLLVIQDMQRLGLISSAAVGIHFWLGL
ncbi:hypothetical protein BDR06DRAFT_1056849 [Suillus hirtellus]|nr:hypothetical protein BDR06DRAFT_1056849 [Suillus hirtellus]